MSDINIRVEKLSETIQELRLHVSKQEVNFERMNDLLERLTETVEIHVKRSDTMEELLMLFRKELEDRMQDNKDNSDKKFHDELEPIKSHISFVKGAIYMIGLFIGLLALLHQFGLLKF
jgi:uncharacterized coiled-coil protein SlyX